MALLPKIQNDRYSFNEAQTKINPSNPVLKSDMSKAISTDLYNRVYQAENQSNEELIDQLKDMFAIRDMIDKLPNQKEKEGNISYPFAQGYIPHFRRRKRPGTFRRITLASQKVGRPTSHTRLYCLIRQNLTPACSPTSYHHRRIRSDKRNWRLQERQIWKRICGSHQKACKGIKRPLLLFACFQPIVQLRTRNSQLNRFLESDISFALLVLKQINIATHHIDFRIVRS